MYQRQVLHGFFVAIPKLAIERCFPNQGSKMQGNVAFISKAAIGTAKYIAWEFKRHIITHSC
jgi:hypothetical protein